MAIIMGNFKVKEDSVNQLELLDEYKENFNNVLGHDTMLRKV